MRPLSAARLRQLASERQLILEEDDLARLRPMVEDLLAVAEGLCQRASEWAGAEGLDPRRNRVPSSLGGSSGEAPHR